MARAIDADILAWGLKLHFQSTDQECELDRQWAVGYNAGLERALYSISHSKKLDTVEQEWISVKDKLPEEKVKVLVVLGSNIRGKRICIDQRISGNWRGLGCLVTHWMPLPEPPERDGE